MRDLDLFGQYLDKLRARHLQAACKIAAGSINNMDYLAIVQEAKKAEQLSALMKDLELLQKDSAEFVKLFLS